MGFLDGVSIRNDLPLLYLEENGRRVLTLDTHHMAPNAELVVKRNEDPYYGITITYTNPPVPEKEPDNVFDNHPAALQYGMIVKPFEGKDDFDMFVVGSLHPKQQLERLGIEALPPQGQTLSKEDYPELYEALTKLGYESSGDDFKLPDFRGHVVQGDADVNA